MAKQINLKTQINPMRMFLYGNPGSTKTRTAGSSTFVPEMREVLYIDASGNPVSLRDYKYQPIIIEIEQLKDVNDPFNWITNGQSMNHPFAKQFGIESPVNTLIIDQLTDIQRFSFGEALGAKGIGPGDFPVKREWAHYNKVLYQMTNLAKLYFTLPIHVIMIALEREVVDDSVGAVTYQPSLEGQSSHVVPSYANIVGRMVHKNALSSRQRKIIEKELGEIDHAVAFFTPGSNWPQAKDQYGALPQVLIDPDMTKIYGAIFGGDAAK